MVYLHNGTFGQKKLYYRLLKTKVESNDYFILFHGSYGSSYSDSKYRSLEQRLLKDNLGNVFTYETSRNVYKKDFKGEFDEYQNTFLGKTFKDELKDVKILFDFFFNTFVHDKAKTKLHFIGFSIGGTISTFLIPKYDRYIRNVFLFGSGITTKFPDRPLNLSYPQKEKIISNLNQYHGNIFLIQGEEDNQVPLEPVRQAVLNLENTRLSSVIRLRGVDHSFRKIDGIEQTPKVNDRIFDILKRNYVQ